MPAGPTSGSHGLDDFLEGRVLVIERPQVEVAHPGDQLPEAGVAGHIRPEGQRVHEEPDQIVEGLVGAARGHRTQGNVVTGSQAAEKRCQHGVEDHERRGSALGGDAAEALGAAGRPW